MVVQCRARECFLSRGTSPNRIDTVLATAVERTIAHAFVKSQEESRSPSLKGATAENIRHKALQIVIAILHASGAAARSAAVRATTRASHVVAVIRGQPHEVRW